MRHSLPFKLIALGVAFIFGWNQVVFAARAHTYEQYRAAPVQPVSEVLTSEAAPPQAPLSTTTVDFLANRNSPLSPRAPSPVRPRDRNRIYDDTGKLKREISRDGTTIHHVYEGESIQAAIDGAASGDTVYLHAGTYHAHVTLKDSVNLKGEDSRTTILHGDYQTQMNIITAQGNNRIEDLTVTGGGAYSGYPESAIRVQGDNVKIRGNRFIDNRNYGIHIGSGSNALIEENFFKDTYLGVQLPNDTTVIRYNTFVGGRIAINSLNGAKPYIGNNIFTGSTFQSIYEFSSSAYASGQASRGFAIVENNTFFNNTEHGSYYGSATPPAAAEQRDGNLIADPLFIDPAAGDYRIQETSSSSGRGAFLPEALQFALDRASSVQDRSDTGYAIQELRTGEELTGWLFVYDEGSIETFYKNGTKELDTTPPQISIICETMVTNQASYELVYTVDGVQKNQMKTLIEGDNTLTVTAADIFGNSGSASFHVVLDQTPPVGSILVDHGAVHTTSQDVMLYLSEISDALSAPDQMRFSVNGGETWTNFENFSASKPLRLPAGNGPKEVRAEIADQAGNRSIFSYSIQLVPEIAVQFTSVPVVTNSDYLLTYTVNGTAQSERWQLSAGVNSLLVRVLGDPPTFARFDVTLDQPDIAIPDMPSVPTLADGLISMTAQNGLVVKYDGATVVSVENPGAYQLFLPQFDADGALMSGVLQFSNGDKLLYQNSKPVLKISAAGEKTVYNDTGTVNSVIQPDGTRIRFSYRLDDQGQVLSLLSRDTSAASLYEGGNPSRIVMPDGTDIRYENGFLSSYRDANGNVFQYQITELQSAGTITGYKSVLFAVTPSGESDAIAFSLISENLSQYPTIQSALNDKISTEIDYDASSKMTQFTSGKGEVLKLNNQLPVSLKDSSDHLKLFENTLDSAGEFSSLVLAQDGVPFQAFDANGNLSTLTLSDGTVFRVTDNKLGKITLSDGSVLTGLMWNVTTQIMTDYVRTYTDGTQTTYVNSHLVRKEEPNGNITTYVILDGADQPEFLTTADGRTYRFIIYKNAQGLMDRRTELVKMILSDGSRVEFENGKPVRYIRTEQVQLDPYGVPVLPADRSYVASVVLSNAELRSLTIDSAGSILSGEILFNDGSQYFLENGALVKQVTADGKIVEVQSADPLPFEKPTPIVPDPLTASEIDYRNELVDAQFNYFTNQLGIDADSGLPVDNYLIDAGEQSAYSQATLVGFWAEILAAIAKGDYEPSTINQTQAFQKLESLLAELQKAQSQSGWNGMFSFFRILKQEQPVYDEDGEQIGTTLVTSYSRAFDSIGIGDNLNLSVSLASVLGALSGMTLQDPSLIASRDSIVTSINSILSLQDVGYAQFYDTSVNRFYSERKFYANGNSYWTNGHMDRVFTEFLPGLVWLAARNPSYKPALDNLDVTIRPYQTQSGTEIENAVPFDGGAFQMFWPLMHVDETKYPEFNIALNNFLYTQAEFANQNGIPGLLSAGDDPGNGYKGKIGLPAASETDDALATNIGSLYGTAGAFLLAPHYTLQFLKNIEAKFPGIRTSSGFVDAIRMQTVTHLDPETEQNVQVEEPVLSTQSFGVDQASFILSLLGTSQNYFTQYLEQNGLSSSFDALYEGMSFNLAPVAAAIPEPPAWGLSTPVLYDGTNPQPDGLTSALTKRSSFISTLTDPEFGEGHIYDYLDPDGNFHNTEIEFGTGSSLRKMTLAQYLLLPGRGDMSRSLFSAVSLDLLNEAADQNSFYTFEHGYANSSLVTDSIGEVRHVNFDFQQAAFPVGLYALYHDRDLSQYDYISVPVRLGPDAPDGVSLKFEFKGMGEIFVIGELTRDWQYFQIPIVKPAGLLQEIAVSIQSPNGSPISGDVYLGPLSAFKVRTSNQVDWQAMLGKSDPEIRALLKSKVLLQPTGGGVVEADEILEDFTLDSDGKLVDGVLKRADGSIQYFRNGQLMKWVFRNGRTVIFEKGLATFILDLAQGQLQEGRFYYDETFRGEIESFVVQDNDTKRVYGPDGKLQTIVKNGRILHFTNGQIDSIVLPESTLTELVFADDQSLLRAHVRMNDGREFNIDEGGEQVIVRPNGVKIYYKGPRIVGVETPANGKTTFSYTLNMSGQMTGVDATFDETVIDGTGNPSVVTRTLSLFDYLLRPERSVEKQEILREEPKQIIPIASIGGFSNGALPTGEITYGAKLYKKDGAPYGWYHFQYNTLGGTILGMVAGNNSQPVNLSGYDFIQLTIEQDPVMTWNQDFNLVLKTATQNTLYSFELDDAPNQYQAFGFSLAGKSGDEGEITLEVVREAEGVGKTGLVYIKDISYVAIKTIKHPLWEGSVSISASELQGLKVEADTFTNVGAEIASHIPLSYDNLVPLLDMPSSISYSDQDATHLGQLVSFKRFDGAEVTVSGSEVTKVVLPDGTVNEYSAQGNASQGNIQDPSAADPDVGSLNYHYGELRKITQSDGKVYEISYEFDALGNPITLIKDNLTGDTRRFKDGKLIESASSGGVSTTYQYQNGELMGAELFYKNRVLQNSSYKFLNNETQVTDEVGTTWYYDANGNLVKHLTKDGYLYAYSDYVATPQDMTSVTQDGYFMFSEGDLKGDFDSNALTGNGLSHGWDQGVLDVIRTKLGSGTVVTQGAWCLALNQILFAPMRSVDYQAIKENASIQHGLDEETKALLDKALTVGASMSVTERAQLNRSILEVVYPQQIAKSTQNYKWANLFNAQDLQAVTLIGYETKDGMQIKKGDDNLVEIESPAGAKAVNIVLDDERKIKNGQIQFADGLILEIENYLPVRGRLADGSLFSTNFPTGGTQTTILQDGAGAYTGSMFQVSGTYYSYDAYGYLTRISSPDGGSYQFTYQRDASGNAVSYDVLHHQQADFNGVPFPEEMSILAGNDIVLSGSNGVLAKREGDPGFIISTYDESLNHWKVLSGQFASDGDRILLRDFLTDLKAGQYVAVVIKDPNFSKAGDEILSLLEEIGADQVRAASAGNQTWCLFGNEYLKKGEGREQVGGGFFSTAAEDTMHVDLAGKSNPVVNGMNLILAAPKEVADVYSVFLQAYEPNKLRGDLEKITVYNSQNQIVYSESLDGIQTFYDQGKPKETYASNGELLCTHEYGCPDGGCPDPNDPYLAKVTLVKARLDFERESEKSRQQIEQVKFDALEQLAQQEEVAQANIKQEVAASIAALDATIRELEAARYQTVKHCRRILFWTSCEKRTFEVPGVAGMISEAQNQKIKILQDIQPEQIATIPTLIEQKKLEIESAIAQKMTDLATQEESVFHDILQREVAPVLADVYRRLLGRDPSTEEVDAAIARFETVQAIDLNQTITEIRNSSEFQSRTDDKAAMIGQIQTFLNAYVETANELDPVDARTKLAQSLQLNSSEVVELDQEEVTAIINWLQNRDLHFGQSAFLSLKNMLASRGIDVPMVTLGVETILVDILTGTINKFAEGDLVISVFAFQRVAKIHAAEITGVSYVLDDLKALYASACPELLINKTAPCNLRVIAHVAGDHFVVITAVTADGVTFFEINKGPTGGLMTETFDQFMKTWDTGNGTGHLVVYKDQAITEKIIDDQTAMKIRGAFFFFDDLIFWFTVGSLVLTAVSIVVSYISPTLGRVLGYAAMVAGIVAIAASVVNFAVQGINMALSSISHVGLLQSVQNGFTALGNAIWEGVAHVGQFLKEGFTFLTEVFSGGFSGLGAGITNMANFVMDGVKIMVDPAGALVKQNLTFGQMVGRSMIAAAINIPVSKGLEGLGIDPRMARLAGAFVSGGIVGLGAGTTGFLQSGMQMYLLQGVSEIGLKLNLPPPITGALSIAVNASLTGLFNPNFILKDALPQIFPQFTQQLTLGGIELLGRSLGLDPRITALIGLPIAASIGGIVSGVMSDGTATIFNSIKNALFSSQTLAGLVSIGASIGLDALGAPPVLQSFLPGLLSQLTVGLASGTGSKIFSSLMDNVAKFGKGVISAVGNVISFGAKVLEGAVNLTKAGFAKAVEFFSGIFDRSTQETLIQAGGGSIENAILNNTIVLGDTARVTFGGVDMTWNQSTGALRVVNGNETRTFNDLRLSGSGDIFFNQLDYYNQLGNGSSVTQTYLNNQLWNVSFSDSYGLSLAVQPLDSYAPITFDSLGNLQNGQINYSQNEWLRFVDGALVEAHFPANSYGALKDPFHINEMPDSTILMPSSGITAGDLKGLDFSVTQDASGNTRIELGAESGQQSLLDRLFGKLRSGAESFENGFERLKNRLLLFGPYTDEELAMHKELEIQKVLADSGKIYMISCKTNAPISFAIRGSTYQIGYDDSVNHTAIVFQKTGGEMYVLDIEMGRGLGVTKFSDWVKGYTDIEAQNIVPKNMGVDQMLDDIIYGNYVNRVTMQPKIDINYDYLGAVFNGGLNLPIPESPDKRFCSSFVYDIMRDVGISLPGISMAPDPNELRHAFEKYNEQVSP